MTAPQVRRILKSEIRNWRFPISDMRRRIRPISKSPLAGVHDEFRLGGTRIGEKCALVLPGDLECAPLAPTSVGAAQGTGKPR